MSSIRYICLSDTHFGEEDSLLTNINGHGEVTPGNPSPVMIRLVECMKHLISETNSQGEKPTLVLNGDILELALATEEKAAMVFERFIALSMPVGKELFDRIIFIPGNHDHHYWEVAREVQYGDYISHSNLGDTLEAPWHTTSMFVEDTFEPVIAYFLTRLIQRFPNLKPKGGNAQGFIIPIVYPNFGILKGEKCVVFHHGHFVESTYQLMSTVKTFIFPDSEMPQLPWDIEAENFAWIDFLWSTLGRSGKAGEKVEVIYEKLRNPEKLDSLISNLAKSLADRYNIPKIPGWLEDDVFRFILKRIVDRVYGERSKTVEILTSDAEKGLWTYVEGPVRKQILIELADSMPVEVTFVFGHTHKPFQKDMAFRGYRRTVNVYNTGGWVVESVDPEPLRGGAIVLIDEELNATSLRMYNEEKSRREYIVKVEEAGFAIGGNSFHQQIRDLVDSEAEPWRSFSDTLADEVQIRARNLRTRINR